MNPFTRKCFVQACKSNDTNTWRLQETTDTFKSKSLDKYHQREVSKNFDTISEFLSLMKESVPSFVRCKGDGRLITAS